MSDIPRKLHLDVIRDFLFFLNSRSNQFVLKGGTSLLLFYSLDRFSEDIDLDGFGNGFVNIVNEFADSRPYIVSKRIPKDTDTVKRAFIHYKGGTKPLKIEVSYRKKILRKESYKKINNVLVYSINDIFRMKINAYNSRDKVRDLYDLCFIYKYYNKLLSESEKDQLRDAFGYKGLEQFDYLIHNQKDALIDKDKLANNFLEVYYSLDLQ